MTEDETAEVGRAIERPDVDVETLESEDFDRGDCQRDTENARLLVRARDHQDVWGQQQVLECRACGTRWSQ